MPAPRFHPFSRLAFCALGIFGVGIGVEVLLALVGVFTSLSSGANPTAQILELSERFALPLTVIAYLPMLGWIWFCRTRFDRRSMVSLGLRAGRALPNFARGMLVGALSIAVLWAVLWVTGTISVAGWSAEALEMGAARAALSLGAYAAMFFAVGVFEETLFRGYFLHNASSWLSWRGALVAQAALFALVHMGNVSSGGAAAQLSALGAIPSLFLIAVFFGLSYRKTGSLWFPIGFHFAWKFCLGCVFSLPVSGIATFHLLEVEGNGSYLSGGAFGAEGSPFLIPIIIALIVYLRRAPDHPQALLDLDLLNHAEAPAVAAPAQVEEAPEPEDDRPNRYGTKFGTSQGFSADTLRELRELQEARERDQAAAREAAKREEQARVLAAAPQMPVLEPLVIAPETQPATEIPVAATPAAESAVEAPVTRVAVARPKNRVFAPKIEVPKVEAPEVEVAEVEKVEAPVTQVVAPTPDSPAVEVVAPPQAPSDEPVKKKAAPRW